MIPLHKVDYPRLDAHFLPFSRNHLLPELNRLKHQILIAGQVLDGDAQGVRQRDEYAGTWHRLVPFVLADRLSRHPTADAALQSTEGQASSPTGQFESVADQEHHLIKISLQVDNLQDDFLFCKLYKGARTDDRNGAPSGHRSRRGDLCDDTRSRAEHLGQVPAIATRLCDGRSRRAGIIPSRSSAPTSV